MMTWSRVVPATNCWWARSRPTPAPLPPAVAAPVPATNDRCVGGRRVLTRRFDCDRLTGVEVSLRLTGAAG